MSFIKYIWKRSHLPTNPKKDVALKLTRQQEKNTLSSYGKEICAESPEARWRGAEKNLLCGGIYQDIPVANVMFPCTQLRATRRHRGRRDCGSVPLPEATYLRPPTPAVRQQGERAARHKDSGFKCLSVFLSHASKAGVPP